MLAYFPKMSEHPNTSGMNKLGDIAISEVKNMKTVEVITLSLSILGAVTGTISFFILMWEKIKYRPRVAVRLIGVYNIAPNKSQPRIIPVVKLRNMGKTKITVQELPNLIVQLDDKKKKYKLDPPKWDEPIYVELKPLEIKVIHYYARELEEDIESGEFPDIRKKPEKVHFEIKVKTTEGNYETSTIGLRILDKNTIDWLKKVGGIQ